MTPTKESNQTTRAAQSSEFNATALSPGKPQRKRPHKPGPSRHEGPIACRKPLLRFSPTAWAKLLFFRDKAEVEIGGFGVTPTDDLLYVEEFATVKQEVTAVSVSFDDEAVADLFDVQVDAGRKPEQFVRIWLHTHPGESPEPSSVDEETFRRVFGRSHWALMFVIGRTGRTCARLTFNVGPGGSVHVPVEVDFSRPFPPSDHQAWQAEYKANIRVGAYGAPLGAYDRSETEADLVGYCAPDDWLDELAAMEPEERHIVLAELSARPDLWEESEVTRGLD